MGQQHTVALGRSSVFASWVAVSLVAPLVVARAQAAEGLSLEECITEALRNHPDAAVADSDVMQAEAGRVRSRSAYLPSLSLQAGAARSIGNSSDPAVASAEQLPETTGGDHPGSAYHLGLNLYQKLFAGGALWNTAIRAQHELRRTHLQRAGTRERVALTAMEAFFELQKRLAQLQVLEQSLAMSQEQLRLAEERNRIGTASRVDVSRARVSAGEDRIRIRLQRSRVRAAEVSFNTALGRPPAAEVKTEAPRQASVIPNIETPSRTVHPPRLAAALAAKEVADLDVSLAMALHWPSLAVSVGYGRQSDRLSRAFSRFDANYAFTGSLILTVPIFDGFLISSRVQETEARATRLGHKARAIQQQVDAGLAIAESDIRTLQEVAAIESANIEAARLSLLLTRESYGLGQGTALEVRDAQLAATRAGLAEVETRFDLQIAVANYHYALGDLLPTYRNPSLPVP